MLIHSRSILMSYLNQSIILNQSLILNNNIIKCSEIEKEIILHTYFQGQYSHIWTKLSLWIICQRECHGWFRKWAHFWTRDTNLYKWIWTHTIEPIISWISILSSCPTSKRLYMRYCCYVSHLIIHRELIFNKIRTL